MAIILLSRGLECLIDDADLPIVDKYKWYASPGGNTFYARSKIGRKMISMHRLILGLDDPSIMVDHKDRNGLNNQRNNLRTCNRSQNAKNRNGRGASKFVGVSRFRRKQKYIKKDGSISHYEYDNCWIAHIKVGNKYIHLGLFKEEEEAALAYDLAAIEHHGEFASLNFAHNG